MHIVSLYAAVLALLFVWLSVRTLRVRRSLQIAIGDGGNPAMLRAMRVHSNFAEYVPLSLLLIYLVEAAGAQGLLVNILGCCLLAGRLAHAFGVSRVNENYAYRIFGMTMTFTTLAASSLYLLYGYVAQDQLSVHG